MAEGEADMIEKLILFENAVETLGYFSRQLAVTFEKIGYRTFFVDHNELDASMKHLKRFVKPGNTAVLTFNFIGLSEEDYCLETDGRSFWETRNLPCYCIMVDHPLYYFKQLTKGIANLVTFCVDRQHVEYMHRFYPGIPCFFLPLAGNVLLDAASGDLEIPYQERTYDVAFIGNHVFLPSMREQLKSQTQEYIDFYNEILNELKEHPNLPVDASMERFIRREIPQVTDEEIASSQHGMLFLELYIRTYYREKVVRQLVDNGIKVYAFGKQWEHLNCEHPENLIAGGRMMTSRECVNVLRNSKIALNVMPWFKDGAHDRIFTAMLSGAVALTDDSIYLNEILTEGKNAMFYYLDRLAELPERVNGLLNQPQKAMEMVEESYLFASRFHTWEQRALELHEYISDSNKIQ